MPLLISFFCRIGVWIPLRLLYGKRFLRESRCAAERLFRLLRLSRFPTLKIAKKESSNGVFPAAESDDIQTAIPISF
jgi:hypothetical protein